jgi:hypothetical protein
VINLGFIDQLAHDASRPESLKVALW